MRISPYDSSARRHTSFSSVWVYPEVDDDIDIEVNEADLRIDTYRASGAGGQHVNTTDSAVRITHVPTGIVVACQNQRSQHKNRAEAMKQLKARLYEAELQQREAESDAANAAKTDIGWGHQIRSYVLQPYQLVKDLRTGVTSTAPGDVLDGELDRFMAAALSQRVTGETGRGRGCRLRRGLRLLRRWRWLGRLPRQAPEQRAFPKAAARRSRRSSATASRPRTRATGSARPSR